jgi:putative tryptophan/tyrosine transport system substrate-binding protein
MRRPALRFGKLLAIAGLALATGTVLCAESVVIVLSDQKGPVTEFAQALDDALRRTLPQVGVRTVGAADVEGLGDARLVIAAGSAAQAAVIARPDRPPVLAVLAPRASFERQFSRAGRVAALYLDHPEERQLALIAMLPAQPSSVAFVASPASGVSAQRLRSAAQRLDMRINEFPVTGERDAARAIQEATSQSEVLLAHPDPAVFNTQTIQSVLLTTYRARVPVVGFSSAYTRAGALMSLHSSAQQLAEQTADMARQALQSGLLPASQYPRDYEVSVNRQVARSLGIEVPAESVLVERLRQRERPR